MLIKKVNELHKQLEHLNLTDDQKDVIGKLIQFYKEKRKLKIKDAIEIIDVELMHDSMFIGAEMEMLNEEDDTIRKVREEMVKLQKAKELLTEIEEARIK